MVRRRLTTSSTIDQYRIAGPAASMHDDCRVVVLSLKNWTRLPVASFSSPGNTQIEIPALGSSASRDQHAYPFFLDY